MYRWRSSNEYSIHDTWIGVTKQLAVSIPSHRFWPAGFVHHIVIAIMCKDYHSTHKAGPTFLYISRGKPVATLFHSFLPFLARQQVVSQDLKTPIAVP